MRYSWLFARMVANMLLFLCTSSMVFICASKSESLLYEYALGSKFGMLVRISFPSAGTEIVAFLCSAISVVMCALSASNDGKAAVCKGV